MFLIVVLCATYTAHLNSFNEPNDHNFFHTQVSHVVIMLIKQATLVGH